MKFTNTKLEYINDKNLLLLLLENSIHCGVSSIMGQSHVVSEVHKHFFYIDANNLYGWAMSQYHPTGELEKVSFPNKYPLPEVVEELLQIPDKNKFGYSIECDLEYIAETRQINENSPLCPYQVEVNCGLFSNHMNSIKQSIYKPTQNLVCDLSNNQKYMMH